jgi:predicted unusual protein kinase regulating ubiquinone biosynthesis (AarF/ABC1/UbiB family)
MKPVLVAALNGDPAEIFADFDETPVAAASLAQVYSARLRSGGRRVAVKVRKPDIRHTMEIDLDFAQWLAEQLHHRSEVLRPYNLPAVVAEARRGMLTELDFRHEARNQEYFNVLNPHPEQVFAPVIHAEFSSETVLVMDFIEGENVAASSAAPEVRREIAARGAFAGPPGPGRRLLPRRSPRRQRRRHARPATLFPRLGSGRPSHATAAFRARRFLGGRGDAGRRAGRADCGQPGPA